MACIYFRNDLTLDNLTAEDIDCGGHMCMTCEWRAPNSRVAACAALTNNFKQLSDRDRIIRILKTLERPDFKWLNIEDRKNG